jgi:metal-responsive CopG/Arc/MetJ family transcriptional regulator
MASEEQTAAVEGFADENARVDALKDARREILRQHEALEEKRGQICDKIAAVKAGKYKTLEERIKDLQFSDAEMYTYIRFLERVEYLLVNAPGAVKQQ